MMHSAPAPFRAPAQQSTSTDSNPLSSEEGRRRSKEIDVLRALAVFLVFGAHTTACPPDVSPVLYYLTKALGRGGWIGVDLFFVLSGFLVSGLLFREHQKFGTISGTRFLARRGLKIYPAYWLLIIAAVVFSLLTSREVSATQISSCLLFTQNYIPWHLIGHTWSIAVEEHFYLLLLTLFLHLTHRVRVGAPFQVIPKLFILISLVSLTLRLLTAFTLPYSWMTHLFPTHLRLDSLFFGVLIAYFYHYHSDHFIEFVNRHRMSLLIGGGLGLAPAFLLDRDTTPMIYTVGLTLFYLSSGCILSAFLGIKLPSRNPIVKMLGYMGAHSYSIYLWHAPVGFWFTDYIADFVGKSWNWYAYVIYFWGGSIAIGIMIAKLVELPILKLRDKWYPSRARALISASPGGI